MAFWDRFIKRRQLQDIETNNSVSTEETGINSATEEKEREGIKEEIIEADEKEYSYSFVLTEKEERERIIEFVRPIKDKWEVINLMLAFGVKETAENVLIARTKNSQCKDDDTGMQRYTTYFVALVNDECYEISYTGNDSKDEGELQYNVPDKYKKVLIGALDHWRQWEKRNEFEKELKREDKEFSLNVLNSKFTKTLWDEVENISKKHYDITCEADAKALFSMCNALYIDKSYDEETVKNFTVYATTEKKKEWAAKECSDILEGIIAGDTKGLYKKLNTVSSNCSFWLSASDDDLSDLYTKACRILFVSDVFVPMVCINSYLGLFETRYNPLHVKELLELTESYLKEKYADEYKEGDFSSPVQRLKRTCSQIRGKIAELSPVTNEGKFSFVLTAADRLDTIVAFYKEKYNNIEAVKEELAYMNCAYGIENEDVFLTASSEAADSLYNQSWDMYDFVAVLKKTNEVVDFRCRRGSGDGKLELNYYNGSVKENWELLEEAVAYFRNKTKREIFFEKCSQDTGKNIYLIRNEAHKRLFGSFESSFGKQLERIGNNPLGDTLREFIEMCEEVAPGSGFDNTIISEPASLEEIEAWEREHEMKLPDSYRNFLLFADGVQVCSSTEQIFGIAGLKNDTGFYMEGYYPIGCTIGDGTSFCLSKSTGNAYIEDHGELEEYGDFENLLKYWIGFLLEN